MKKILHKISLTIISRLIFLVLAFLINIVIAHFLGPIGKGMISLLYEFFFISSAIALMGVHEANIYFLGNKKFDHRDIFTSAIYQTIFSSIIIITLCLIIQNWLLSSILRNVDKHIFLIALTLFPALFYQSHIIMMLLGNKNIIGYNIVFLLQPLCALILQLLLIPKMGVSGAIISNFLGLLVADVTGTIILLRYGIPKLLPDTAFWKSAFIYGFKSQVGLILSYLNRRLPIILINLFLSTSAVGYFALALTIAELSWYIPESVGVILFPEISRTDMENAGQMAALATRNTLFIISLLGVLLIICAAPLIKLFFGPSFLPSTPLLRILVPGMIIFSINRVLCSYFAGTGKPEYGTYTGIISFIFMVALNVIMIPKFGLISAPIASLIAFIASSILAIIIFMKASRIGFRDIIIIKRDDLKRYVGLIFNRAIPQ